MCVCVCNTGTDQQVRVSEAVCIAMYALVYHVYKGLFTFMYGMRMYVCIVYLYVLYFNAITLCCRCTDEAQQAETLGC